LVVPRRVETHEGLENVLRVEATTIRFSSDHLAGQGNLVVGDVAKLETIQKPFPRLSYDDAVKALGVVVKAT